jgi:peptidoglycan/LPS O-acetylase OafA/YrhL
MNPAGAELVAAEPDAYPSAPSPPKHSRKNIPGLDGLRGTAILGVMLFHFSNESHFARIFLPFHPGWVGVDLFFVLSGFLITGILLDSRDKPRYFFNFYMRRVLRIFPLYYSFLLLMLVIYLVSGTKIVPGLDRTVHAWPWWVFYGANFLVAARGWIYPVMGGLWSLAVEEHFYFCWPAFVRFTTPRVLLGGAIFGALASLGLRFAISAAGVANPLVYYCLTPCRLDGLCIGAALAVVYKSRGLESIRGLAWTMLVCGAAGFLLGLAWSHSASFNGYKTQTFGFFALDVMFGGVLVHSVLATPGSWLYKILNGRALPFLGKYSYALYVLHPLVTQTLSTHFLPVLQSHVHSNVLGPLIYAAICSCGSIAMALASWHLIEKRALNLKRFFE